MSKRTCSVEGCEADALPYRKICSPHRYRMQKFGTYEAQRTGNCLTCGVLLDRTDRPHAAVPKYCSRMCRDRDKRPLREACMGCGGPLPTDRRRKYCSAACRSLAHRYGGKRPTETACRTCGVTIDLTERMADGSLRRPANTLRCDSCMATARPHRYGMTAAQVAERDGLACKWCAEDVDLSLIGSRSKWAPSVDHVIPWSRGGSNDPQNLQLMHRVCNAQKGTRIA